MTVDASPRGSIIYLEDVTVDFDGFKALNDLNFYMDYRELRVVIGPNGAGKTTLLDVISGKVAADVRAGDLRQGHRASSAAARTRSPRSAIGRKFQTPSIFANLSSGRTSSCRCFAAEQGRLRHPALPARCGESEAGSRRPSRRSGSPSKARSAAGGLSHGEKQWLEIGMVIVQQSELLLVDEPVAGMTDEETEKTGAAPAGGGARIGRCWSSSTTWSSCGASPAR